MDEPPTSYITDHRPMTRSERARLIKLNEELGEVVESAGRSIKAISKALNYGWTPEFEGVQYDNRKDLEKELGDVFCAVDLMARKGNLSMAAIQRRSYHKQMDMIRMIPYEHEDDHLLVVFEEPPSP